MVRLSLRSMAVMAFAVFAAASPVVDSASRPAVENVVAQAPVAQAPIVQAPVAAPAAAFEVERKDAAAPVYVPQVPAFNPQDPRFDMNQMRRMIPCSENDCLKDMSPEEQQSFKRKCEELLLSQQKVSAVGGQSRVANGGTQLKYFQMTIPATANNQRVPQDATGKAVEPQQLPVNANIVQHATSSASCFELGVPTNAPIAHATNMYAMPAATEIKGSSPVNYVEGVQRNEIHAPVVNTVPVAAPVQQSPQVLHDGEETTWMFFPRPQGVNMTPEQEKEWMNECQKTACQKMEAAQSTNKVGGQSRFVPVPPTAKEQAELQKEVKSLFGNNANSQVASHQGANGVAP
ncbi:hypothetical protein LPJ53_002846, partial [Coemansia erecta]